MMVMDFRNISSKLSFGNLSLNFSLILSGVHKNVMIEMSPATT